jgi:hypothetical protein
VKKFVLLRGKESGALYLYDRKTYEFMVENKSLGYGLVLEFLLESDDQKVLEGYQKLVNPEIEVNK